MSIIYFIKTELLLLNLIKINHHVLSSHFINEIYRLRKYNYLLFLLKLKLCARQMDHMTCLYELLC